jgi:N-glycosidase YbiA
MPIHFNSKSKEWCWLSNFFLSPMIVQEKEYPTVEHWFQSQKFTNLELQEKIRTCPTASHAKKLGRTRDVSFLTNWDSVKEQVLYEGLKAKFTQNILLHNLLLKTGSEELIEQSPWDSYWGSGRTGKGQNRMGHLLMKLRSELS